MECREIKNYLSAYLDKQLSASESHIVRTHLLSCQLCQKEARDMEKVWALIGDLPHIEPSPNYVSFFYTKLVSRKSLAERASVFMKRIIREKMFIPSLGAVCVAIAIGALTLTNYLRIDEINHRMASMNDDDIEMIESLDLAENYDLIKDMDLLEDYDAIQQMKTVDENEVS